MRKLQFKGSFPHFRRAGVEQIDLVTFQFDKWGGGFCIEIANCPLQGLIMPWGLKVLPNKVTAHHINKRQRLGAASENADHWFRYDENDNKQRFAETANEVLELLAAMEQAFAVCRKRP